MRALRYAGERAVVCDDRPEPRPGPTEVVLRIQAAGICGSDLHVYRHPGPEFVEARRIPGHEPAGVIEEVGSHARGWSVGDRVTSYFRKICGSCYYCRTGHSNVCTNRGDSYGDLLRPLGMAALVGLGNTEFRLPLGAVVHRELVIFGTSIFPTTQYEEMWRFFRRHNIAPSQVVTHRFGLEQGAEAFRLADSAAAGKVCFAPASG
jgi:L-iditol 2-dehydrogenase